MPHIWWHFYRRHFAKVMFFLWWISWRCIKHTDAIVPHLALPLGDVKMSAMVSQITSVSIVCSNVCSGADKKKHQSSTPLAWWPVDSSHKGPVTSKTFPFDDVIMVWGCWENVFLLELELKVTSLNLANQVKLDHALVLSGRSDSVPK